MIFNPGEELLVERYIKELKEKDLQKTPAIEKYGYGAALRSYYGLPRFFPLNFKSQHGVCLWDEIPSSELKSRKKLMLVFNRRWLKKWEQARTGKWVIVTPNPFLLYKRKHKIKQSSDAAGSVFFYAHSTAQEHAENDCSSLIEELKGLLGGFGECIVPCIMWISFAGSTNPSWLRDSRFSVRAIFQMSLSQSVFMACFPVRSMCFLTR